jgi:hypothetical protein
VGPRNILSNIYQAALFLFVHFKKQLQNLDLSFSYIALFLPIFLTLRLGICRSVPTRRQTPQYEISIHHGSCGYPVCLCHNGPVWRLAELRCTSTISIPCTPHCLTSSSEQLRQLLAGRQLKPEVLVRRQQSLLRQFLHRLVLLQRL